MSVHGKSSIYFLAHHLEIVILIWTNTLHTNIQPDINKRCTLTITAPLDDMQILTIFKIQDGHPRDLQFVTLAISKLVEIALKAVLAAILADICSVLQVMVDH